jgi:hypothetical protein
MVVLEVQLGRDRTGGSGDCALIIRSSDFSTKF